MLDHIRTHEDKLPQRSVVYMAASQGLLGLYIYIYSPSPKSCIASRTIDGCLVCCLPKSTMKLAVMAATTANPRPSILVSKLLWALQRSGNVISLFCDFCGPVCSRLPNLRLQSLQVKEYAFTGNPTNCPHHNLIGVRDFGLKHRVCMYVGMHACIYVCMHACTLSKQSRKSPSE